MRRTYLSISKQFLYNSLCCTCVKTMRINVEGSEMQIEECEDLYCCTETNCSWRGELASGLGHSAVGILAICCRFSRPLSWSTSIQFCLCSNSSWSFFFCRSQKQTPSATRTEVLEQQTPTSCAVSLPHFISISLSTFIHFLAFLQSGLGWSSIYMFIKCKLEIWAVATCGGIINELRISNKLCDNKLR